MTPDLEAVHFSASTSIYLIAFGEGTVSGEAIQLMRVYNRSSSSSWRPTRCAFLPLQMFYRVYVHPNPPTILLYLGSMMWFTFCIARLEFLHALGARCQWGAEGTHKQLDLPASDTVSQK